MDKTKGKNKIPQETLKKLCQRIRLVRRFAKGENGLFLHEEGWLYYLEPIDPYKNIYEGDPGPVKRASGLRQLGQIETEHRFEDRFHFAATIADVVAQIPVKYFPEEYLDRIIAFEIDVDKDDFCRSHNRSHCYKANVILYIREPKSKRRH